MGLLMAIERWWRRRATLMPAYDQHDTRRQTTTSMAAEVVGGWWLADYAGFLGALNRCLPLLLHLRHWTISRKGHALATSLSFLARARAVALMLAPAAGAS
jgi:hypothetical protein